MTWKEWQDTLRERSIALALVTQLFVAAFSAFLTIGLVGLYDPDSVEAAPRTSVAYVPAAALPPGDGFDVFLTNSRNLRVTTMTYEGAQAAFHDGRVSAIIEEHADNGSIPRYVSLFLPEGEFATTLLVTQLKGLLRDYERELRILGHERIEHNVLYVDTGARPTVSFGFVFSILLPLLVATPVFLAGAVTGDAMSHEIQTRTLLILRSTPLSTAELVLGKLLAPVALVPAQVFAWVVLLGWNGLHVHNTMAILVAATLLGAALSALSLIVAVIVRREGMAQSVYAALVLIVGVLAFLLPQDPLNLVARLAVGEPNAASWMTIAAYGAVAIVTVLGAFIATERRFRTETV